MKKITTLIAVIAAILLAGCSAETETAEYTPIEPIQASEPAMVPVYENGINLIEYDTTAEAEKAQPSSAPDDEGIIYLPEGYQNVTASRDEDLSPSYIETEGFTLSEAPEQDSGQDQEETPETPQYEAYCPEDTEYASEYDRRLINRTDDGERLYTLARMYSDGEDIKPYISDVDDLRNVSDFYRFAYFLGQPGISGMESAVFDIDQKLVDLDFDETIGTGERADLINRIVDTYGLVLGETEMDTVQMTAQRVQESMDYCEAYTRASMKQCLDAQRGVCWTTAEIYDVLLTLEGIDIRRCIGIANGAEHEWLECCIDGSWYIVETTITDPAYATLADESKYETQYRW